MYIFPCVRAFVCVCVLRLKVVFPVEWDVPLKKIRG